MTEHIHVGSKSGPLNIWAKVQFENRSINRVGQLQTDADSSEMVLGTSDSNLTDSNFNWSYHRLARMTPVVGCLKQNDRAYGPPKPLPRRAAIQP
jgi:hypothetical protein